jgi:hypothetical protein
MPPPPNRYAFVTGRTLVLPASTGWYLMDWGPMHLTPDGKVSKMHPVQEGMHDLENYHTKSFVQVRRTL